jgi:hypothetical protein
LNEDAASRNISVAGWLNWSMELFREEGNARSCQLPCPRNPTERNKSLHGSVEKDDRHMVQHVDF